MKCPTCGRPLPGGAVFCPGCDRPVPGATECDDYTYEAFISYRHVRRDRATARFVQRRIEGFRLPSELAERLGRKQLGRCFRDEDELPASDSLPSLVEDALARSRHLVVICSPEMRESHWVEREIELFSSYHGRDKVLLALSAGEPEDAFPSLMVAFSADGQAREPLAADLRGSSRARRRDEALRLVAAIVGCGYDDLRQRERARRRGRMAATALVFAVASLAFAAFALFQQAQIQENYEMALVRQSEYLADEADTLLARGDRLQAVQVALEALGNGERAYVPEARLSLERALQVYPGYYWTPLYSNRESSSISSQDVIVNADKTLYATLSDNDVINVYDLQTGLALCQIEPASIPDEYTGVEEPASRYKLLFAGEKIICVEDYSWVVGYDARSGEELYRTNFDLGSFEGLVCTEDGSTLACAGTSYTDGVARVAFLDAGTGEVLSVSEAPGTIGLGIELDFSGNPSAFSADGSTFYQTLPNSLCAFDRGSELWNLAETGFGIAVDMLVDEDALYVAWFDEAEESSFVVSAHDVHTLELRWSQRFAATSRTLATIETPMLVEVAESEIGRHLLLTMDTHIMLLGVDDGSIDLNKETTGVVSAAHVITSTLIAYVSDGSLSMTAVSESSYRGVAYQGESHSSSRSIGMGPDTGSYGVAIFARDNKGYCLLSDNGRTLLCQLDFQMDLPGREDVDSGLGGSFARTVNGAYLFVYDYESDLLSVLDGSTFDVLTTIDPMSFLTASGADSSYCNVAPSSEFDDVLYVSGDDKLCAVDVASGEMLGSTDGAGQGFEGASYGIDTFDGRLALVTREYTSGFEEEHTLLIADARTLEVNSRVSLHMGEAEDPQSIVEWCLFGDYVITVERDDSLNGHIRVFDASTGERVESALDEIVVARTSGELAGHFVESGISRPEGDAEHYLTFDEERNLLAAYDAESGSIRVFDLRLRPVWESSQQGTVLEYITYLMFLPTGDLLAQGRTSFDGMGQYLLLDGETGSIIATSNEASLIERGWLSQDGSTLFALTQSYAVAWLDDSFITGLVSVSLDSEAFGEQSQMECAEVVSLDETRVLFYDQVWEATFTLPLYTTDELVAYATELIEGHGLSDTERLLYHLERDPESARSGA